MGVPTVARNDDIIHTHQWVGDSERGSRGVCVGRQAASAVMAACADHVTARTVHIDRSHQALRDAHATQAVITFRTHRLWMSLWMILRIGLADWDYPGDNCVGPL